jgi:hypothetical protein
MQETVLAAGARHESGAHPPFGRPSSGLHRRREGGATVKKLPDLLKRKRRRLPVWRRVLYLAGAVLAFAAGIVGWLLPVVTGIPFLVLGAVLLALTSQRMVGWVNAWERRLPERWRRTLRRSVQKMPGRRWKRAVNSPRGGSAPRARSA